jgi:hypothetical protein
MALETLTPFQKLALVKQVTGDDPVWKMYDEIVRVVVTGNRIGYTVRRFQHEDRSTETRFTGAVLVTRGWEQSTSGFWVFKGEVRFDDPEFKPYVLSHKGGKTVDEWRDQLTHHAMCARPGAGKHNQRDYDSVQKEIARLWSKTLGKSDFEYHLG